MHSLSRPMQMGTEPVADIDNPPNTHHYGFNSPSAIVNRRLAKTVATQGNDLAGLFQGFASIISALRPDNQAPAASSSATSGNKANDQTHRNHLPKISLDEFCLAYEISDSIKQKLEKAKITGPHALNHLKDDVLIGMVGLDLGELGDLRHAQEGWIKITSRD